MAHASCPPPPRTLYLLHPSQLLAAYAPPPPSPQDAVFGALWLSATVYLIRLLGVYLGCWLGGWMGETPPESRKRLWAGMVTQAGIALGLAKIVSSNFPTWGPNFATAMVGVGGLALSQLWEPST